MSDKIAGAPAETLPTPEAPPQPAPVVAAAPAPAPEPPRAAPVQLELAEAAPTAAPEPPPAAAPTPEPAPVDGLRAELAAELERARSAREAVEAISQRAVDRSRIAYLRKMGVSDTLSDDHLMTLAPQVDPDTNDGAAALVAWREQNGALFTAPAEGAVVTAQFVEKFKTSKHGTFGPEFHRAQMRATFGGE